MSDLVSSRQREFNRASAEMWDQYAEHRARVTQLVLSGGSGRLVVLGAGNCNDLDLATLAGRFDEIHLVDLDGPAMAAATDRQRLPADAKLYLHGDVDVTALTQAQIDSIGKADVVASTTLLTQLLDSVGQAGGDTPAVLAARDTHLLLMADLLAPRGFGLLVTDVVSSDTCPEIRTVSVDQLAPLMTQAISMSNFFTGTNPFAIEQRLGLDPSLPVRPMGVTAPWRWDIGDRSYLVCAIGFRRLS